MKSNFKITIPNPCNENWDEMTPNETGRFCRVCNKSVIDFTSKLPEEIQHFFLKNQGQKICGRFKNSQLDSVNIQIPSEVLLTQKQYHKMFLLALFVVMGTSLFSCSTLNGDKQRIEKIEVIDEQESSFNSRKEQLMQEIDNLRKQKKSREDSIRRNSIKNVSIGNGGHTMGPMPFNTGLFVDSVYEIFSLPKSENKKIYFQTFLPKINYKQNNHTEEKNIETEPYFPGGVTKFYAFFAEEFKMPENTKLNTTGVTVMIQEDGSITYDKSYPDIDKPVKEEIIRVLKLSPKWQPVKSDGIAVSEKSYFMMAVK